MKTIKCPQCGKNAMKSEVIPKHRTRLGGVPVEIPDAKIEKCAACGEFMVSATELKRWRDVQRNALESRGQIPSPRQVKEIRRALQMSVQEFAKLFGVTRQTVYAWESEEISALQLGPAALLLNLLIDEQSGTITGISPRLREYTRARSQVLDQNVNAPKIANEPLLPKRRLAPGRTGS